jgi:hypothetical protein
VSDGVNICPGRWTAETTGQALPLGRASKGRASAGRSVLSGACYNPASNLRERGMLAKALSSAVVGLGVDAG